MEHFGRIIFPILLAILSSCSKTGSHSYYLLDDPVDDPQTFSFGLDQVARVFAALPIESSQMNEVYDAVCGSCENGYDEEYTMSQLFSSPGCGVGESSTKSVKKYARPMRDLLKDYLSENEQTKGVPFSAEEFLEELEKSDLQIYWPYSEDWNKETLPVITFDPGYGSNYNYGYELTRNSRGELVVQEIMVDESVAMNRPVWVINRNDDASSRPLPLFEPSSDISSVEKESFSRSELKSVNRILRMKSFTMLRNYDPWFKGGSEFYVKCGSVNGFSASTEAELKLYSPSVTDFMVSVKRKYLNVEREYNAIIMTNFTNQLENLAFLVTEDDGGTQTSWKCSATVKIKSKSYGFDVEIPYRENDDIVWRGQLSASFFQSEDVVTGRFGDVIIKFELE